MYDSDAVRVRQYDDSRQIALGITALISHRGSERERDSSVLVLVFASSVQPQNGNDDDGQVVVW